MTTMLAPCFELHAHDCHGNKIAVGDTVYLPAGWTGTKPNPWKPALVIGVCIPANGRPWLELDGYDLHRVPAYITSKTQPI